jgi:hypothetical protein
MIMHAEKEIMLSMILIGCLERKIFEIDTYISKKKSTIQITTGVATKCS